MRRKAPVDFIHCDEVASIFCANSDWRPFEPCEDSFFRLSGLHDPFGFIHPDSGFIIDFDRISWDVHLLPFCDGCMIQIAGRFSQCSLLCGFIPSHNIERLILDDDALGFPCSIRLFLQNFYLD
jgi:hypothetical protein